MEEAPTPKMKIEPEGAIEHLKKFEAIFKENIKYEISIYKRGIHFGIETEIQKDSLKTKYFNYFDLDTLKKSNKFLALCDGIDDVIDTIYENATNYTCNIFENQNDYEVKIPVSVKSIKEISFILKEKKKSQDEIINDLVSDSILSKKKIEEQNQKINELEIRIKFLEEENNKMKNEIKENMIMKNEIKEIIKKEVEQQLKAEKEKGINPIIKSKSKIINDKLFELLNTWINPFKSLKFEKIFTASVNGDSAKDFHNNCDGKGPTVTIVKSTNGHIFGGYVTVPFSSDGNSHYDDKAFLFSLTNNKKFPIKIKEQAVCHLNNWGPYIGYKDNCDLAIDSGCLKNNKNNNSYSRPNSYEFNRVDLIGTNEEKFQVIDYEVYLVN